MSNRVEGHAVESYMHVVKRGARGMPITQDENDRRRFARLLYHMNDHYKDEYWEQNTASLPDFERPASYPERRPLVAVLAWTLMPNHFHLILREITENGIAKFMQKLGNSMSTYNNLKYNEKGSLFQGSYKGILIDDDEYLRWVASYVMVKNVFELYPGGLVIAADDFDKAWRWAQTYEFSSFTQYAQRDGSPLLEKDILGELFSNPREFKDSARDMILARTWEHKESKHLILE